MNRAYIIIDCWPTVNNKIVSNIYNQLKSRPHSHVIVANYGGPNGTYTLHPLINSYLQNRAHYAITYNTEHLAPILAKHRVDQVCIMGSDWPACTHNSPVGVRALQQLQLTVPFELIVYPTCVQSYHTKKLISHHDLFGWTAVNDYFTLPKTTPLDI